MDHIHTCHSVGDLNRGESQSGSYCWEGLQVGLYDVHKQRSTERNDSPEEGRDGTCATN